jgi:hypothetical protein
MCGHRVAQAHIELASHPRSERLEMRLRRGRRRNQRDRERHAQYERFWMAAAPPTPAKRTSHC